MLIRNPVGACLAAFALVALAVPSEAVADHPTPTTALSPPGRRPSPPRDAAASRSLASAEGGSGWWVGTAGVALALALCGWGSVAARRYLPRAGGTSAGLRVIGRTSLSAKQTVYLLQVGDRVLIVGAGAQGSPSLLGELDDREAIARLVPRGAGPAPGRPDPRLGDDT